MTSLPIVERELRVTARQRATYWVRLTIATAAIVIGGALLISNSINPQLEIGPALFWSLSGLSLLYCFSAGRLSTADCISQEKRDGTIGFLFLTDLKGYDIVFGKVVATSLNGFYGLLAVFPVLAVPLLLGGMTNGELWRMVTVLVSTFLLSIAVGIFTSSLSRDFRRALAANFLTLLLITAIPAVIGGLILYNSRGSALIHELFYSCPGYAFYFASEPRYIMNPDGFWYSIGVIQFITFTLLALTSWIVPRSWQDRPSVSKIVEHHKDAPIKAPCSVRNPRQIAFRKRLLDVNAYYWLTARNRFKPVQVWLFLGAACLWWFWVWLAHYGVGLNVIVLITLAIIVNTTLKVWITLESGHRLLEDKRAGALELLLTTPLNGKEILRGQLRALRRQFLLPMLAIVFVEVVVMIQFLQTIDGSKMFFVWLAGISMLLLDIAALIYTSMAAALSGKSLHKANLGTLFRILTLPWILFGIIALGANVWKILVSANPDPFTWKFYLPIWFALSLTADAFFGWKAFQLLNSRFHELAARQDESTGAQTASSATRSKAGKTKPIVAGIGSEQSSEERPVQRIKLRKRRLIVAGTLILAIAGGFLYQRYLRSALPPPAIVKLTNNDAPLRVFPCEASFLIIPPDGSLWHWGRTAIPPDYLAATPVRIGTETDWSSAAGDSTHWIAIKNDGTLWEWGQRSADNLGFVPRQVGTDTDWEKIHAGISHSVALKRNGTLWAWGDNRQFQLGTDSRAYQHLPIQIGTNSNWSSVDAFGFQTFGLRTDGTLWVWGQVYARKRTGQPNRFTYKQEHYSTPTRFNNGTNWNELMGGALVRNREDRLYRPDGFPDRSVSARENCTPFLSEPLTGPFSTGLIIEPTMSMAVFQVKEDGTLWATPVVEALGPQSGSEWRQYGERSDWVSVWGRRGTILGQSRDNTLWIWGLDLGQPPELDFAARLRNLRNIVGSIFGQRNRRITDHSAPPIQKSPRPLMKFVEP